MKWPALFVVVAVGCEQSKPPPPPPARSAADEAQVRAWVTDLRAKADAIDADLHREVELRDSLVPTEKPCPVELREPPVAGRGETLGESALRRGVGGDNDGDFSVDTVKEGSVPESPGARALRKAAVELERDKSHSLSELAARRKRAESARRGITVYYWERESRAPKVRQQGDLFDAGFSSGTAYLWDRERRELICSAEVEATNTALVTAKHVGREAARKLEFELFMDLRFEINRSIARNMRLLKRPRP